MLSLLSPNAGYAAVGADRWARHPDETLIRARVRAQGAGGSISRLGALI
jgi:hypothetical protein